MNRLHTEQARLFAPSEAGQRWFVVGLRGTQAWQRLAPLWTAVQSEAEWPAPLIAVNGVDGCGLWFSLATPVPPAKVLALQQAWRRQFFNEVPPAQTWAWPDPNAPETPLPALPPVCCGEVDGEPRWAAFVAPDLAAVFSDAPWLDLPPGDEAQADLLSRHRPVPADAWARACARWLPAAPLAPAVPAPMADAPPPSAAAMTGWHDDPRAFLRAVMNDPQVPMAQRIEAAKALLAGADKT